MALLKIYNDIECNINNGNLTALTLLDLSAAFDTIDHHSFATLAQTLWHFWSMSLLWFSSYLSNRYQRINITGSRSCHKYNLFEVTQRSVLGPVLFLAYTLFHLVESLLPIT